MAEKNPYADLDILVIANPVAGRPEPVITPLAHAFGEHDLRWQIAVTSEEVPARQLAAMALDAGVPTVVAYGGDGTLNEVAGVLRDTGVLMGIIPGGTANVFAAELRIPTVVEDAARVIAECKRVLDVDLGEARGEGREPAVFVLRLGSGMEADIVSNATREDKDRLGYGAYLAQGVREIVSLEPAEWTITSGDREERALGISASIANAGHMGFAQLEFDEGILVDDGLLDAIVIPGSNLAEAAISATALLGSASDRLVHVSGKDIKLSADPPQTVVLDGESYGKTPVSARVLPHALKIIVPAA